ncbi:MAG: hypothetical protein AAGI91_16310 [Bacteroidota bacterium]
MAAQDILDADTYQLIESVGWNGFTDYRFLGHAVLVLILATVLGALIAYHPRTLKRVDTLDEAEAPKVYITYAVVGAVIGLMVVQYGLVVGFVVFGIGGLFRFRTTLPSTADTGRLILVALIGLSCGLGLPHLGVLTTAFGFVLIFFMERTVTCQLYIKNISSGDLEEASAAYLALIERDGRVIRQSRNHTKKQIAFVFRVPNGFEHEAMERSFDEEIPSKLHGIADWEVY